MAELLELTNPVFTTFVFTTTLLVLKMLAMSVLTGLQRFRFKAFGNPEDSAVFKSKPKVDEHVERVRRAHRNDLENILPFTVLAFAYMHTNPPVLLAKAFMWTFTLARFAHTYTYLNTIPQPSRGISFGVGMLVCVYMAIASMLHFMS